MRRSSQTITLFGETPSPRRPSAFVLSIMLHGFAIILLYGALKRMPRVIDPLSQRYMVRILNLDRPSPKIQFAALRGITQPAKPVHQLLARGGGRPAPPSGSRHIAQLTPAPQTLIQPDLPPNVVLPQAIPIPTALLWATQNSPTARLIAPPPQQVTNASVQPTLDPPNQELKLSDVHLSATAFMTESPLPPPGTSSPLRVRRPDAPDQVPQTGSKASAPPTPARVMSLSDLLVQRGAVPLPAINETAPTPASDSMTPERPSSLARNGDGDQLNRQTGTGPGETSGNQGNAVAANGLAGDNGNGEPSLTRITLPRDGHFGVVVIGSSPAEEYPEAMGVWTDRLAYTVYLHVGLARSWILQYALPPAVEAASAGNVSRPDAPWPYVVVRPHLAPTDTNGDAIMIHGLINIKGQFERLAVVFPQQFPQAQFVLSALQQWQFRPATQNGQITPVEVLLIIPRES